MTVHIHKPALCVYLVVFHYTSVKELPYDVGYHWTPQKISVHMFFSLMAYLFLALIYNEIHSHNESVSLISTVGYLKDINLNYAIRGKSVTSKIECKSEISDLIGKTMDMQSMIKD